jgi:hypothetical protein
LEGCFSFDPLAAGGQDSVILGEHMKPVHIPPSIVILIFLLVAVTFLAGTLHTFDTAHAAASITPTATASNQPDNGADLTPTPEPTPDLVSADTTGIIALAIIIVIIVLIDAILGNSRYYKKKPPKKKS